MTLGLLANAQQQFLDQNGDPLVGGFVFFYVPNTLTKKNTWQNVGQTILNSNPIVLDGAGRGTMWGTGVYRQILTDKDGNLIWDKNTTVPASGGSGAFVPTTITFSDSPYTVKGSDIYILCVCTLGPINILLYDATLATVQSLTIKKIDATANAVTVTPHSGQTIDESTNLTLNPQNDAVILTSDIVSNWLIS